ncbi:unnamed protein product [Rhodiola kirilowii]
MMVIRSGRPLFASSSPFFLPLKSSKPTPTPITHFRRFSATANMSIEHLVLFKVKTDTPSQNLSAMIDGLNGLTSQVNQLLHLTAGPIHRNRYTTQFTHLLHSRYKSKEDLAAYSAHPAHVSVVKDNVLPICDEIMAVDWIADDLGPISPGSAMRITLLKLKDDSDKEEVLKIVRGVSGAFDKVVQNSFGENFSPARAKGFTVASLAVYGGIEDLEEANNSKKEVLESYKENVRPFIDGVVDVEYVIPSSYSPQSANL